MEKTVSVIVPVYNASKCLERCVDSLLSQTYRNLEIILVDDGSTDASPSLCDEYAVKDKRVIVYHKANGGVGSARNLGLEHATGDWIVFMDSDDWADNCYIDSFFTSRSFNEYLCIQGRYNDNPSGENINKVIFKPKFYDGMIFQQGIVENGLLFYGAPYSKLYNAKIIRSNHLLFPENYSFGEDTIFFLRYLFVTKCYSLLESCGYHYIHYEGENLSCKKHPSSMLLAFLQDSWDDIKRLDNRSNALCKDYMVTVMRLVKQILMNIEVSKNDIKNKFYIFTELKRLSNEFVKLSGTLPVSDKILLIFIHISPVWIIDILCKLIPQ